MEKHMPTVKQPTTYEEQIEILRRHGCIINDEADCKNKLSYIGINLYHIAFPENWKKKLPK